MQRQLSEIEKHGAAAGETGRPHTQDWTIDQGWDRYTAVEHGVWKTLFERQTRLLPGRACDEFVAGMRDLPITALRAQKLDVLGNLARVYWYTVEFGLLELAHIDFGPLYDRVRALPDFDPGDVLPTDAVISRGTGRYHRDKRNGQ
jgi:phenylalanine-4-hydroxylase